MVKIVHLSDLHYCEKDEWEENFHNILNALSAIRPDVMIVTGDLVDHPTITNYQNIELVLFKMLASAGNPPIVIVPGNHDIYAFGIKNLNLFSRSWCFDSLKRYLYSNNTFEKTLCDIYKKYEIAIFPFDSNSNSKYCSFAQGNVDNLNKVFARFRSIYVDLGLNNYDGVIKIACLHHHPVPMATRFNKKNIENFLVLRNSYEFVNYCSEYDIDIVLHGHNHVSNIVKYDIRGNAGKRRGLVISSCSTSGKDSSLVKEFKLLEISPSKSINIKKYESDEKQVVFTCVGTESIVPYGDIRKKIFQEIPVDTIKHIQNKTKVISIDLDGSAYITISSFGIEWCPGNKKRFLEEVIRSDYGRISSATYEFYQCPITGNFTSAIETWENNYNEGIASKPDKPEFLKIPLVPLNPKSDENHCLKLAYFSSSCFALTQQEYKERYNYNGENGARLEEYASISTKYKTDSLELIVRFPPSFFPDINAIYLLATKISDQEKQCDMPLLYPVDSMVDEEETAFIKNKGALRIRPDMQEVAIIIKYPKIGTEYSVRWKLPKKDYRKIDDDPTNEYLNKKIADYFREVSNRELTMQFYKLLEETAKSSFLDEKEDYSVFLFVYNNIDKKLHLKFYPKEFNGKSFNAIVVGRGPAGKAFKRRRSLFWNKHVKPNFGVQNYPIEEVISGYKPVKVFAMPLLYPDYIEKSGMTGKKDEVVGPDGVTKVKIEKLLCPAWGSLTIASINTESFPGFDDGDKEAVEAKTKNLYISINKIIKEFYFSKIVKHIKNAE